MISLQGAILRSSACQVRMMLASRDVKVSTHWSPGATEIRGLSGMICALPCCSGSRRGLFHLGLSFFSFPLFGGPPVWQPRCHLQDTQGWSPELGDPYQETHLGTPRTAGFSTVLAAVSPVSCFGTMVSLGVFFCPAVCIWGWDGRQFFRLVLAQVWHQENPSWLRCLPRCGLGQVSFPSLGLRCLFCKAGGDDTSSSL